MGLNERVNRLATPTPSRMSVDDILRMTDAEFECLIDSIRDVNLCHLTDEEVSGLIDAHSKAEVCGETETAFMTPDLGAAL